MDLAAKMAFKKLRERDHILSERQIRIGIIGTGFARTVQLPVFRAMPGADVVAVCSAHREKAEETAKKFDIPHAFTNYRELLKLDELDLVSIVTPPHLHHPMALAAIEAEKHVLLEKPMALDLAEARELYQKAEAAQIIHLIDHELRFAPMRRKFKELVDQGFLGQLYHVNIGQAAGRRADPQVPWDWWSDASQGGGLLGAVGSHQIDQLRWWFGEIEEASGHWETFVRERPLPGRGGKTRLVETDDFCSFQLHLSQGGLANVTLSSVARHGDGWQRVEAYGSAGTLILGKGRLWGAHRDDRELVDLTEPDPLKGQVAGLAEGEFPMSFAHFAHELIRSISEAKSPKGTKGPEGAATFYDGMRCQAVLDGVRRSQNEGGRWVPCGP
jgi:predicted dehydrogenase